MCETASCNDGKFFQGTDATVGDDFSCNNGTFFLGTDATVGDGFSRNDGTHISKIWKLRVLLV